MELPLRITKQNPTTPTLGTLTSKGPDRPYFPAELRGFIPGPDKNQPGLSNQQ